ncbi:Ctd small phosphatase-like protein [Thalictrum thalictroides]|uniref:Ctd small phosphatase-like protein n=1 Tax=Thalictrum thalictroides TaxID=46969 RepID=A0A7J6WX46_THATH|nr:Ctd small phosphatase-like protein [Thalictrum thalictroides]
MQTKKKLPARNAKGFASPRVSRAQKKAPENVQVPEKKVAELITSSPRKHRCGGIPLKKNREVVAAINTNAGYIMTDEIHSVSLGYGGEEEVLDVKGCDDGTAQCLLKTIFSPTFHIPKDADSIENASDIIKFFRSEDEKVHQGGTEDSQNKRVTEHTICSSEMDVDSSMSIDHHDVQTNDYMMPPQETNAVNFDEDMSGASLSSEVSAIYLAMQQSKLECVDEPSTNSFSSNAYVEADDIEEVDYFDPYLFIKSLPDLSSVVPTYRPVLLPKKTRSCPPTTLVLDLDETLVHSSLEACDNADFTFPVNFNLMKHTVYVRCRPHLMDFMERVASLFEIIIFTASQSIYAEQLLNVLDPKRRIFRHRVYRDSCVFVEGNYLKDLSILGRDLSRVIIIDNSPQAFGFQVDNGIPIESWFDDHSDQELLLLLPFLETLVGVADVRPLIAKKFNLREKIAAAVYPSLHTSKHDQFER